MDVDEALTRLGKVGKWHIIYYTIISLAAMVPAAFHMLAIVFIGRFLNLFLLDKPYMYSRYVCWPTFKWYQTSPPSQA